MLKNIKYRSTIVSKISDLAAPTAEKYKVQINYLSFSFSSFQIVQKVNVTSNINMKA
jgi:hypothetical protein